LNAIESLSERIVEYNDRIEALSQTSYPQVELLKQIKGVGTLIALTFLLTLEDPHRFGKSRDVGCYLGLRGIRIGGRCWCRERSISWDHSGSTVISDAGA
jgi:transposase